MNAPASPPRFVPTLTEVVLPAPETSSDEARTPPDAAPATLLHPTSTRELEEQLIQRVLQRVDMVLERRLRETMGQLISEHTQALAPRLREEIELVVRESVGQAFGQESGSAQ